MGLIHGFRDQESECAKQLESIKMDRFLEFAEATGKCIEQPPRYGSATGVRE